MRMTLQQRFNKYFGTQIKQYYSKTGEKSPKPLPIQKLNNVYTTVDKYPSNKLLRKVQYPSN